MSNTKTAPPRSLTARWLLWMTAVAVTAGVVTVSKLSWPKLRSWSRTREDAPSWPASTRAQDTAGTATVPLYDGEAPAPAATADDAGWIALLESSQHDDEVPAHAA